jgi:hypothetical protein
MRFVVVVIVVAGCGSATPRELRWHHARATDLATRDDDQPRRANVPNHAARVLPSPADPRVPVDLPP